MKLRNLFWKIGLVTIIIYIIFIIWILSDILQINTMSINANDVYLKSTSVYTTKQTPVTGGIIKQLEALKMPIHVQSSLPKIVHFAWCTNMGEFTFTNFLAVRSAVVFLQPDIIYFHCDKTPANVDKYNTWFDDILSEVAWLKLQDGFMNCSSEQSIQDHVLKQLSVRPGIFLGINTIIIGLLEDFWHNDEFRNNMVGIRNGYITASVKKVSYEDINKLNEQCKTCGDYKHRCISYPQVDMMTLDEHVTLTCIFTDRYFCPKHIWHKSDNISKVLNYLMYGSVITPHALPSPETLIPNIAHMYWVGGQPVSYLFYLSALSLLYIVKVDHLYIYGDAEPMRKGNWKELIKESRVTFILKERPVVFGQRIASAHHMSDVFRADIMTKYGGIYSDVDVIWTQPISEKLRRYDAVGSLDWAHNYPPFPEYINLGVCLGKKGSKFWELFLDSMKEFRDRAFGYNGLLKPYKIYERHPETLLMYDKLQVMCFRDKCYPLSGANFTTMDWHKETHAFHWTYPDPVEFQNRSTLLSSSSMFAQMGQNVLRAAGQL